MTATSLSRTLALWTALSLTVGCNDTSGPSLPNKSGGLTGGLTLVPRTATIELGRVVRLHATLVNEFGDRVPAAVQWKSSDEAIATVAASGEVYGRAPGRVIITASAAGKSQTSTIRVLTRSSRPGGKDPKFLPLQRRNP